MRVMKSYKTCVKVLFLPLLQNNRGKPYKFIKRKMRGDQKPLLSSKIIAFWASTSNKIWKATATLTLQGRAAGKVQVQMDCALS